MFHTVYKAAQVRPVLTLKRDSGEIGSDSPSDLPSGVQFGYAAAGESGADGGLARMFPIWTLCGSTPTRARGVALWGEILLWR